MPGWHGRIAGLVTALIAFGAKTERDAWAWLCLVNAAVSIGILVAMLVMALTGSYATFPEATSPPAPVPDAEVTIASAFRFAVASGLLGLVVTALAAGFLVATYLLMRGKGRPSER